MLNLQRYGCSVFLLIFREAPPVEMSSNVRTRQEHTLIRKMRAVRVTLTRESCQMRILRILQVFFT